MLLPTLPPFTASRLPLSRYAQTLQVLRVWGARQLSEAEPALVHANPQWRATTLAPAVHPHRHLHSSSATHRDTDKQSRWLSIFSSPDNPTATEQEAAWHASTSIPPHSFSPCTRHPVHNNIPACVHTYPSFPYQAVLAIHI